jgi:predicted DNA-binding protein with PD1-like motif
MIAKALEPGAARSFFVILEEGDEVMESLKSFALEQGIEAARFSGIGALRETTVAFFKAGEDESREILFDEQVQVLSCMGTIGVTDAGPVVHGHLVLSLPDGHARGGHLVTGKVRPKLELVVLELPGSLHRGGDDATDVPSLD